MNTIKCAIYARYSTDMQRPTSIDDQIRMCKEYAESRGWHISDEHIYRDVATSGTSIIPRTSLKGLLSAAMNEHAPFKYVVVDDTSRIARSLREALDIFTELTFRGIHIHFVSQQIDTQQETAQMMITMHGLFDELFVKELAKKVHRGLTGAFLRGYSTGARKYGYRSKPVYSGMNDRYGSNSILGYQIYIYPQEAEIVKLIFKLFGEEKWAARRIANYLNGLIDETGMPKSPNGRKWSANSIYGKKKEGLGILNNELYIGRHIWNRRNFKKNPKTGKYMKSINPPSEWKIMEQSTLRIIDDVLWKKVKQRQHALNTRSGNSFHSMNFLTPVAKCGQCGGTIGVVRGGIYGQYGCTTNWNQGSSVCSVSSGYKKSLLETKIIAGLCDQLLNSNLQPTLYSEMCEKINSHLKTLAQGKQRHELESEMIIAKEEQFNISNNIKAGYISDTVYDILLDAESKIKKLNNQLALLAARDIENFDLKTIFTISDFQSYFEKLVNRLTTPHLLKEAFYSYISKVVISYHDPYVVQADLYEKTEELNDLLIKLINNKLTRIPIESGTRFSLYTTRVFSVIIEFPRNSIRLSRRRLG